MNRTENIRRLADIARNAGAVLDGPDSDIEQAQHALIVAEGGKERKALRSLIAAIRR